MDVESLSWQTVLWRFTVVIVLILINGFFVAAEFGLVGARRTRLKELSKSGNRLAHVAEKLIGDLDQTIAATQLGITVASLFVGWIGEETLAEVFMNFLHFLPPYGPPLLLIPLLLPVLLFLSRSCMLLLVN